MSAEALAKEPALLSLLLIAKREAGPAEPAMEIPNAPEVTLALLRSARTDVRTQSMGSRAVHRSPRLAWDVLIEIYGDEDTLRERIEQLREQDVEGADDLLDLAARYLSGWRPSEFGDD